jgi:uncharacterized membrane protein YadS
MSGRSWAVPAPLRGVGPGFLVSAVIAGAASLIAFYTGGPVMLFALVIGMAMNFVGKVKTCQAGIAFSSKFVLRLGVALLGFKITLGDVLGLGWGPVLLVIAAVSLTTLVSVPVPQILRDTGNSLSRFCLIASIAALGIKSRFKDIAAEGWRPVVLMVLQTVFIAAVALVPITLGWI